ncbi:RluA family pseudouridine synthase, partial [Streptococcus suis]
AAPRRMLHAQKPSLTHPLTLEEISVEALSESFEKVLRK